MSGWWVFISATKEGMLANSRVIALVLIVRVTSSGASTPSIVVGLATVVAPQYTIHVELESVSLAGVSRIRLLGWESKHIPCENLRIGERFPVLGELLENGFRWGLIADFYRINSSFVKNVLTAANLCGGHAFGRTRHFFEFIWKNIRYSWKI